MRALEEHCSAIPYDSSHVRQYLCGALNEPMHLENAPLASGVTHTPQSGISLTSNATDKPQAGASWVCS